MQVRGFSSLFTPIPKDSKCQEGNHLFGKAAKVLSIVLSVIGLSLLVLSFSVTLHPGADDGLWSDDVVAAALLVPVTVRVDPSASTGTVGDTFTINVVIDNALNLGSFQFDLTYDPVIVQATDVTLGTFLGSTGRSIGVIGPIIDNTAGQVTFGAFSFGSQPGPSGTGLLATINFSTAGVGSSLLDLQNSQVTDTLGNPQIPVTEEDGTVSVMTGTFYHIYLPCVMRLGMW